MSNGNQREKIKAGTPSFLPPEMVSGEEYSSNQKLDIWALGVILYLMVEGNYPFEGKNTKEIIRSILKDNLEFDKKITDLELMMIVIYLINGLIILDRQLEKRKPWMTKLLKGKLKIILTI